VSRQRFLEIEGNYQNEDILRGQLRIYIREEWGLRLTLVVNMNRFCFTIFLQLFYLSMTTPFFIYLNVALNLSQLLSYVIR
jgi:hypothetical protein